jgi:D-hexose-6-phosphate mutarotase
MQINFIPEKLRRLEIPGRVDIVNGHGHLPLIQIHTPWSSAEIYLAGAHVAAFQKNGEPPLLFLSAHSHFTAGEPLRGGIPICFPWFGPRAGQPAHGLARLRAWELVAAAAHDDAVTVRLHLPPSALPPEWSALRAEFIVTVAEQLTLELLATNESKQTMEIENCLHTYFHVGDIGQISLAGLQGAPFDDFAAGAAGARQVENDSGLRIAKETNRVYPDNSATVEIRDEQLQRVIRVEKFNSQSTVVWNPWTTQKMPDDFGPAEYRQMVCVESGNVKQNKIPLAPGKTSSLRVKLSSASLK